MIRFFLYCFCYLSTVIISYGQFYGLAPSKMNLNDLSGFKPAKANWSIVGNVSCDPYELGNIPTAPGKGILVNIQNPTIHDNLFTVLEHGDAEFDLEFMMPKGSNSGIYLQGRYEVQMFDSWGVEDPTYADCGGIYCRWNDNATAGMQAFEGYAPRINVSRAPGLWQNLHIIFQAPRFDEKGNKISNAKFIKVMQNGVTIHENIEISGPTRAAAFADEKARGPIMIQGDHGSVAIRNIQYKLYDNPPVKLSGIKYEYSLNDTLITSGSSKAVGFDEISNAVQAKDRQKAHYKFTGNIDVITTGLYQFDLISNGYKDLQIDQKSIKKDKWDYTGQVELTKGSHPFVLDYYREWYEAPFLGIYSEGPGSSRAVINDMNSVPQDVAAATIVSNDKKEPVFQRSFNIHQGKMKTACISVGNADKVNYMLDLEKDVLLKVWKGEFLDCSSMWIERGSGETPQPLGAVVDLSGATSLGILDNENAVWPDSLIGTEGIKFIEYTLDSKGYPTFKYKLNDASIADQLYSEKNGQILTRQIKINFTKNIPALYYRLAEGKSIKETKKGFYSIDDQTYYLNIKEFPGKPIIRTINNRDELIIPLKNKDNYSSITYSIIW